jgi:chorismate mutase / prephenate dehydratase
MEVSAVKKNGWTVNCSRAAFLGPPGTFSHEAAVKFFQSGSELVSCGTAREVIRLYREEKADAAILAIDSSIGGTVGENLDALAGLDPVRIIGETMIAVHHHLIGRPGMNIRGIKTVLAHPKAIEECDAWLSRNLPEALRVQVPSSAGAVLQASADFSGETAAISSKTAADLYRMKPLAAHIENSPLNTTLFWAFGRECPPPSGDDKTTLLVTGDLNAALLKLVNAKVRILSIYERPSGGKMEDRFYFLNVEGHGGKPPLTHLLERFPEGKRLGSYPGGSLS